MNVPGGRSVVQRRPEAATAAGSPRVDVLCTELELSAPAFADVEGEPQLVRVLVRLHQVPIGFVSVGPAAYARHDDLHGDALHRLRAEVTAHLAEDGVAVGPHDDLADLVRRPCPRPLLTDHVTVVVGTRNRPAHVRDCLEQLLRLDHASFDVVVVDNAPDSDATSDVVADLVGEDPRFRYLRLAEPGVSRARNAGIAAARGPLVAFVDDDVRVDPFWLQGLARAFATSPRVACVTGLVATRTIAGAEQRYFDSRVSWASGLSPRVYHPTSDDPLHPWAAGRFGAGANTAFRLDAVRALGGFDTDLGPGTSARGGEDLDLFVRVLRAGGDLRYDPAALVWHVHRAEPAALERQLFGYGVGLSAYLAKHALHPSVAREMLVRAPRALRHVLAVTRVEPDRSAPGGPTRRYRRIELAGMVAGPFCYLRSRLAGSLRRRSRR